MGSHIITIPYTNPLEAVVYPSAESKGTIVYSHGLFSSKDAYKINHMAPSLQENGYTVISFSYGYTRHFSTKNAISISLSLCADELNAVMEYAAAEYNPNIHIVGSSMGGAIAMYYVAVISYRLSLKSLTLIATPANLKDVVNAIAPNGISEPFVQAGEYKINAQSLREMIDIELEKLIPRIDVPVCIIHGQNDDVVNVSCAYSIQKNLCVPHTMHIIPDGDHALTSPMHIELILQYIMSWLALHP